MHYDPIMCMVVPDKPKDAGGFAPGSKAKIITENEGSPYESFTVEYGGNPLKRGFKSREAAVKYAKNQGLTVDEKAIDKAIRNCDYAYGTAEIKDVNGKWVVFRGGKYVQGFDNSDDAEAFVREKGWH